MVCDGFVSLLLLLLLLLHLDRLVEHVLILLLLGGIALIVLITALGKVRVEHAKHLVLDHAVAVLLRWGSCRGTILMVDVVSNKWVVGHIACAWRGEPVIVSDRSGIG